MKENWISVKTKTPKEGQECLCYGHGEYLVGYYFSNQYGDFQCESDETILENVTHWMPLKPPTK